jgi:hypothetical protein
MLMTQVVSHNCRSCESVAKRYVRALLEMRTEVSSLSSSRLGIRKTLNLAPTRVYETLQVVRGLGAFYTTPRERP